MGIAIATAVIAVLGTLLGSVITARLQERASARAGREARRADLRREHLAAITALAGAVSAHRSMMARRGDAAVRGDDDRYRELRVRTEETRGAVAAPLMSLRLRITDPDVRAAADHMVTMTFDMHVQDGDPDAYDAARLAAVVAHDDFVDVAARYVQTLDA
ncbi:hypothetical protein [Streptomyces sp. NPDC059786]|uniref:hypothetical protein n=1 Tax=Streptomyces sp. NPDC059786 TaxID=3346946 RepID=UPI0036470E95